jgi:DNA-binding transcriptional ArsR family regulator
MIRTLWVVLCVCCVAVMLSEAVGLAFLWSQGLLSARRLREVRDVLGPQEKEAVAFDAEPQPALPSSQDVLRERSLRVLSLTSLETEVGLLKSMIENERNGLIAQRADFQKEKAAFNGQLQQLSDKNVVEAREQSRSVLLALPPADAVERLMQLTVNEDVLLLREMPEAKIALLLKEFATVPEGGGDAANATRDAAARVQRAKEIFDRITKGEPRESIIRSALNNLQQAEAERPATSGNK